jgi:hypothetical protein
LDYAAKFVQSMMQVGAYTDMEMDELAYRLRHGHESWEIHFGS